MPSHIAKVKKKMSIYAKRRVNTAFFGNYGSVFKGRGMDFDDLRPYMYGDDVKDIDWKASARSREPMIRRYVAIRKHNIMIITDSGRNMSALTPSGEKKSDVATFAASVIAYCAFKNNDLVGMTFGNNDGNTRFPLKESLKHIENFLTKYEKSISLDSSETNLDSLLSYISKNYRERMYLILLTDLYGASKISPEILRRLRVRHEQMCIMIEDSTLTNPDLLKQDVRDIHGDIRLPSYIRKNKKLREAEKSMWQKLRANATHNLRSLGISSCCIEGTDSAISEIFKMLEENKHARR